MFSVNEFEDVFLFKRDVEFSKQRQILVLEGTAFVVLFLILNVTDDCV